MRQIRETGVPNAAMIKIEPTADGGVEETVEVDTALPGSGKALKKAKGRLGEARDVARNGTSVSIIFEGGQPPKPEPHDPWNGTLFGIDNSIGEEKTLKPHPQYKKTR